MECHTHHQNRLNSHNFVCCCCCCSAAAATAHRIPNTSGVRGTSILFVYVGSTAAASIGVETCSQPTPLSSSAQARCTRGRHMSIAEPAGEMPSTPSHQSPASESDACARLLSRSCNALSRHASDNLEAAGSHQTLVGCATRRS